MRSGGGGKERGQHDPVSKIYEIVPEVASAHETQHANSSTSLTNTLI